MKNIIVTGGLGFIGSNFILKNISRYKIINIDNLTYASNPKYLKNINKKNYKHYKLNITDSSEVSRIIKKYKPEYIFNFAAETHVDNSIADSQKFIDTNIIGTHSLLKSVEKNKKYLPMSFKFIQISTDEVFGDIRSNYKTKEDDRYNPSSPYSASKSAADHLVVAWSKTFNINYNITYSSNNFGPNQNDEKFIPVILNSIVNFQKIPVYGDGMQKRNWIYVEDNIDGIFKVAKFGAINNSYNIGSDFLITNLELLNKILSVMVNKFNFNNKIFSLIKYVEDRPGHDRCYNLNTKKIKKLKWRCRYNFDTAIEKTIEWYLKR